MDNSAEKDVTPGLWGETKSFAGKRPLLPLLGALLLVPFLLLTLMAISSSSPHYSESYELSDTLITDMKSTGASNFPGNKANEKLREKAIENAEKIHKLTSELRKAKKKLEKAESTILHLRKRIEKACTFQEKFDMRPVGTTKQSHHCGMAKLPQSVHPGNMSMRLMQDSDDHELSRKLYTCMGRALVRKNSADNDGGPLPL
jgi:hypothetical protein